MDLPAAPGIYAFEHRESGKLYIGSTVNLQRRIFDHYSLLKRGNHHNEYMQRAYDKHGRLAFETVILEIMPGATNAELFQKEQEWLDAFTPTDPQLGYNIHLTASATASLGRPTSPRLLAKLSVPHPKWHETAERLEEHRRMLRERWEKPGYREYFSETMVQRWARIDHREKIKAAHDRLKADPEWLAKKRATIDAMRASNETKRKANAKAAIRKRHGFPPLELEPVLCDWMVAQYESGTSIRQIGLSIGMSHNAATAWIRGCGIDVAPHGRARRMPAKSATALKKRGIEDLSAFDAEVGALYADGHSINVVRQQFGVSSEAIRTSLHRSGIPIRGKGGKLSKIPRFRGR